MRDDNNVKVSILVPFYNVENYVGRCVESLFSQTYSNIEYVFVNDCSPDKSLDVIKEKISKYHLSDKCKIIIHEHNKGISASRNDCLQNMTGDYFLFVDSDDYIDNDMVELLVTAAVKADADVTGCGYVEEYPDRQIMFPQKYTNDHNEMMKSITLLTIKGVLWKLLIRSSIVLDHSDVIFNTSNNMGEDYIFCCQVFYYAQRFASVDKCLYHYVQYNPNNVTRTAAFNVECQAFAIREVEMFYREKGVIDIVKNEINQRKFVAKLPLLMDKQCIDVVRWRNLFPECNNVWKGLPFSRGNKFMFQLAQSPFYWLLPVIVKLKK